MLSVIIITKNEEHNIERCLKSVAWANELIVVDSGSTDQTVAIARRYTCHVYSYPDWQGYGVQKQRALHHATNQWVLNLDADEVVSVALHKELEAVMHANHYDACCLPIQMNFYNNPLRYSSSPQQHKRFFKRLGSKFSQDLVHEKIILPAHFRIGHMKNAIMHHSFKDVSHALYKLNRYSSYSAAIRLSDNKRTTFTRVLLGTSWMFFRCYLLQRGFLDGKEGFIMAFYNAQGTFYRGIKQLYPDNDFHATRVNHE